MPNLSEYRIVITHARRKDGRPWVAAQVGELPGCIAEGPTEAAARAELAAIFPDFLESMEADGLAVPLPHDFSASVDHAWFVAGAVTPERFGGVPWGVQHALA